MSLRNVDELFLRAVLRPRRGQLAGVFRRVGITDHDLLFRAGVWRYHGMLSSASTVAAARIEIGERFEQRHDGQRCARRPRERSSRITASTSLGAVAIEMTYCATPVTER